MPKHGLGIWLIDDVVVAEAVKAAIPPGDRHVDTARRQGSERGVNGGIAYYGQGLRLGASMLQRAHVLFPQPGMCPASELATDDRQFAKLFGQVRPRSAGADDPGDAINSRTAVDLLAPVRRTESQDAPLEDAQTPSDVRCRATLVASQRSAAIMHAPRCEPLLTRPTPNPAPTGAGPRSPRTRDGSPRTASGLWSLSEKGSAASAGR